MQVFEGIRHLTARSSHSFQLSDADIVTGELEQITIELRNESNGRISATDSDSATSKISLAAAEIDIGISIEIFSTWLSNKITQIRKTKACEYLCDDEELHEAINNVVTSVWSDNIRFVIQSKISRSLSFDLKRKITLANSPVRDLLHSERRAKFKDRFDNWAKNESSKSGKIPTLQEFSHCLEEFYRDQMKSRGPQQLLWSVIDVTLESTYSKCVGVITMLDVNREPIRKIQFPEYIGTCEVIYNPPSRAFPGGHFDAFISGEASKVTDSAHKDDPNLFRTAVCCLRRTVWNCYVFRHLDEYPSHCGELFTSEHYVCQLKRGRAMIRRNSTIQINQSEYMEPESLYLPCCIEQATRVESVCLLAYSLAELKSRSAEKFSSKHESGMITSTVSRDACELFRFSGSSVEAEVYRQLVEERVNDGHITTALKLCCIGHQLQFCRDAKLCNPPTSDKQSLGDAFEQMFQSEYHEQERYKFHSICDEWYRVLEPEGLMHIEQKELLRAEAYFGGPLGHAPNFFIFLPKGKKMF